MIDSLENIWSSQTHYFSQEFYLYGNCKYFQSYFYEFQIEICEMMFRIISFIATKNWRALFGMELWISDCRQKTIDFY